MIFQYLKNIKINYLILFVIFSPIFILYPVAEIEVLARKELFIFIGFALAIGMTDISFIIGDTKPDKEKLSPYECGFEPFHDARSKFDIRFYLVALLFIIFDLEVAFLFPWAVSLKSIGLTGFFSMMFFLLVLTIGFIYEWKKGALEWE